jgi:predicted metalloprotease with PDZ domain
MNMNSIRLLVLAYGVICNNVHADIVYRIKHTGNDILVQAQFSGCDSTTKIEELYIPERIWGADYSQQIKNVKVIRGPYYNPNSFIANKNSQSDVDYSGYSIEYNITKLKYDDLIDTFGNRYHHFFDKDQFFLFGLGLFVLPKSLLEQKDKKVSIIIDSTVKQIVSTITPYNSNIIETTVGSLDDIVIIGGKRLDQSQDKNLNINIIVPHLDDKFFKKISNMVLETVKKEQDFFDDKFTKSKLFLFVPAPFLDTGKRVCGGTVIGNATIIFINYNAIDDNDLSEVINHESLHFWIGNKGVINGPPWVREGFTDYLVDKINYYYSGDKLAFINKYNQKLKKYFITMVDDIPDNVINDNYLNYTLTEKIYYLKGYIILGQIDNIIDLHSALKSMVRNCKAANNICEFSTKLLAQNIDINVRTKSEIKNMISGFSVKNLNQQFFGAKLLNKHIQVEQIPNLANVIKNGYIESAHIDDPKYHGNQYVHEISRKNSGKLDIYIRVGEDVRHIPLKVNKTTIEVPYYE